MSDTRRADPTLMDHDGTVDVVATGDGPLVAHAVSYSSAYGWVRRCTDDVEGEETLLSARDAAFIAVPCRECFPQAPPPGCRDASSLHSSFDYRPDPGLAWQLGGSDE